MSEEEGYAIEADDSEPAPIISRPRSRWPDYAGTFLCVVALIFIGAMGWFAADGIRASGLFK